jgi:hypothetical protein
MFRVDETFRIEGSFSKLGQPSTTSNYSLVEIALQIPVWIVQAATTKKDHDEVSFWRCFLVRDPKHACEILAMDHWGSTVLQVLLPGYITGLESWSLHFCTQLWACEEPDGSATCWRIETPEGAFLESTFGTKAGEEINCCLLWSAAKPM